MLGQITDLLPADRFTAWEVPWPATVGPFGGGDKPLENRSLNMAVRAGVIAGIDAIQDARAKGDKFALMGYSLGAIVASEIFTMLARGEVLNPDNASPLDPEFLLNVANPVRRRNHSMGGIVRPDLYGIHDEMDDHDWYGIPVYEYADPNDCISGVAEKSPLRILDAAVGPYKFFLDAAYLPDVIKKLDMIKAQQMADHWWDAAWWQTQGDAIRGAIGYLTPFPHGDHVSYGVRRFPAQPPESDLTYVQHAAKIITENH